MILACMVVELLHWQVENLVKLEFQVKFDFEGQSQIVKHWCRLGLFEWRHFDGHFSKKHPFWH